jgi:hypothetical protein
MVQTGFVPLRAGMSFAKRRSGFYLIVPAREEKFPEQKAYLRPLLSL